MVIKSWCLWVPLILEHYAENIVPVIVLEYSFSNLYLFHTPLGPNRNQFGVTSSDAATGLGAIVVNNWPIYDGAGPNAAIVARAQGMHVYAGNWKNVFSIVFEIQRFKGSTLQVMGISVENGEFAIVGGTGQFAMASGVIYKNFHEQRSDGNIIRLTIQGSSPLLKGWSPPPSQVTKVGPLGGDGGVDQDITDTPGRLESITVQSGVVIDAIAFSYADQAGQKRSAGPWGGSGRCSNTTCGLRLIEPSNFWPARLALSLQIQLAPSEFVTGISGTVGLYRSCNVIASLTFVTNVKTYGPFVLGDGTPFTVPVEDNHGVVGFFGRSSRYLDAIGAYVQPQQ
ncbi:mannose/glucose-specific lectin-like [Panicum miliaceum]|uniref:Dirigent protein n=1 Tax=Panicum miliaceum TaxID=4540 RepID=A0A3L6R538_PANMI|nr:mannose/glucose-specific lectin-like [Panicum miliaceum]